MNESLIEQLPGLGALLVESGLNVGVYRQLPDYDAKYDYFINEYLVQSDELMHLFIDAKFDPVIYCMLLWAKHNNGTPFARAIKERVAQMNKTKDEDEND